LRSVRPDPFHPAASRSKACAFGHAASARRKSSLAQKKYDIGVPTRVKNRHIMPYSGRPPPTASSQDDERYFSQINNMAGINGRKINFISMTTPTYAQDGGAGEELVKESDEGVPDLRFRLGTAGHAAIRNT